MKSNPYVYPSKDFRNLSQTRLRSTFGPKKVVSYGTIARQLQAIAQPKVQQKGKTVAEAVLNIFLDSKIRFGDRDLIADLSDEWIEQFNYFIQKNKRIEATLLGFPFKMPAPLKTERTMPDMGELMSLERIDHITQLVKKMYPPGMRITIFTEGGFGSIVGVPKKDWMNYDLELRKWVKKLGYTESIQVKKLSDMEKMKGFNSSFRVHFKENKTLYRKKNAAFLKKMNATFIPFYRLVDSRAYSISMLLNIYNDALHDDVLSHTNRNARGILKKKARQAIPWYFAYLQARDDVNFLRKVAPHAIALSVSPKPGRLGIIPVDAKIQILPYHGVPVYDKTKKRWDILYRADIMRSSKKYTPVHVRGDKDPTPFYLEF